MTGVGIVVFEAYCGFKLTETKKELGQEVSS